MTKQSPLFCALLIGLGSLIAYGENNTPLVPALYVFGDSTVDGGNKIPNISTTPCGIDLDASLVPRWSNGLVISDFIATYLRLPLVPPSALAQNSSTGINYAYAGAGILPTTHSGQVWSFGVQISNFSSSLANNLNKTFSQPGQLSDHLEKSIFLISFGINDYFEDYISHYRTPSIKDPTLAASHLLNALSERLTTLYQMGARKFVVNNIWPMGCMPDYHLTNIGVCNDPINSKLLPYNNSMPNILRNLSLNLPGFDFSYSDDFSFVQDLNLSAGEIGITNTTGMCWQWLTSKADVCKDRNTYIYFDNIHTTQVVNKLFAIKCFNGTLCSPKNIIQLVGA